jgi:hypothetical protein
MSTESGQLHSLAKKAVAGSMGQRNTKADNHKGGGVWWLRLDDQGCLLHKKQNYGSVGRAESL